MTTDTTITPELLDQLLATGVGKSWLASALGHKAGRDDRSVLYQRAPKLFGDLQLARGDGRYGRLFRLGRRPAAHPRRLGT